MIALTAALSFGCGTAPSLEHALGGPESEAPSLQAQRKRPAVAPYRARAGNLEIEVALASQPQLTAERFGAGDVLVAGVASAVHPGMVLMSGGLSVFFLPIFAVMAADWGGELDSIERELAPEGFLALVGAMLEKRMRLHLGSGAEPQKLTVTIDYYGLMAHGVKPDLSNRDAAVCFVVSGRASLAHTGRADGEVTVPVSRHEVQCASIREFLADEYRLLRFASRDAAAIFAANIERQLREQP